ncbi:aldose epimerase [Paenibacillus oenotherae]|uniref:Aldose epimerase n=1 Tax=Paenibacillus oenotherae TaxID=1435645 RepID=A0ABS7D836_9BACL|nr:aldose epimerase [Paenibacillus oenotherae]MBW7476040.1 aldose epimerase [Paenibacillus oenotherae]
MNPYEVAKYESAYTFYTLKEERTNSSVTICPQRGGIATSCLLNGVELFYMEEDTLLDPAANIRGGNPVLFPISGQLENGRYEWESKSYTMRNHGVARNRPWEVVSTSEKDEAAVTLRLRSDDSTRLEYPFDFELLFTYALKDGVLHIRQLYRNLSNRSMPLYAGFHPYFRTNSKQLVYATDATRYLDYNDHTVKAIDGPLSIEGLKESVALLDAQQPTIAFPAPDSGTIWMKYSDLFKYVVLWQVDGKPFVCVEPWMALNAELNRKDELPMIGAEETLEASLSIGYQLAE